MIFFKFYDFYKLSICTAELWKDCKRKKQAGRKRCAKEQRNGPLEVLRRRKRNDTTTDLTVRHPSNQLLTLGNVFFYNRNLLQAEVGEIVIKQEWAFLNKKSDKKFMYNSLHVLRHLLDATLRKEASWLKKTKVKCIKLYDTKIHYDYPTICSPFHL